MTPAMHGPVPALLEALAQCKTFAPVPALAQLLSRKMVFWMTQVAEPKMRVLDRDCAIADTHGTTDRTLARGVLRDRIGSKGRPIEDGLVWWIHPDVHATATPIAIAASDLRATDLNRTTERIAR